MDLNSIAYDTSPAQLLHEQHPTGRQYAQYLGEVATMHELPIALHTEATEIKPLGDKFVVPSTLDSTDIDQSKGFEVKIKQTSVAKINLPAVLRVRFIIWAAG